jgi:hypothetical protein
MRVSCLPQSRKGLEEMKKKASSKLKVPSQAEVKKANAGTFADRVKLSRKYGLSGAVAAAIGLKGT